MLEALAEKSRKLAACAGFAGYPGRSYAACPIDSRFQLQIIERHGCRPVRRSRKVCGHMRRSGGLGLVQARFPECGKYLEWLLGAFPKNGPRLEQQASIETLDLEA